MHSAKLIYHLHAVIHSIGQELEPCRVLRLQQLHVQLPAFDKECLIILSYPGKQSLNF